MKENTSWDNIPKAVAPFLMEPERTFKFKELRALIDLISETNIRRTLTECEDKGILHSSDAPGRPDAKGNKPKLYQIENDDPSVFEKMVQNYPSYALGELLASDYVNRLVEKFTFIKIFDLIKEKLETDADFRVIASKSLMNLSALKEEYKNFAQELQTTIYEVRPQPGVVDAHSEKKINYLSDELHEIGKELIPNEIRLIQILEDFEPVDAVRFYRENIHRSVVEGLGRLAEKGIITEGLHQFLIFDNYLSPLTSYPVNSTLQLILPQPFQRIYEDIYLLDGESFGLMSTRTAAIYNYFPDILFELVRSDPPDWEALGTIIMQMIFHWNVASTRFDLICICLDEIYKKSECSGNYHVGIDGLGYAITDLDSNSQLLPNEKARSILVEGSIPMIFKEVSHDLYGSELMEDPFTCLRPCLAFRDMGWRSDFKTIDEILPELKFKLEEYEKDDEW